MALHFTRLQWKSSLLFSTWFSVLPCQLATARFTLLQLYFSSTNYWELFVLLNHWSVIIVSTFSVTNFDQILVMFKCKFKVQICLLFHCNWKVYLKVNFFGCFGFFFLTNIIPVYHITYIYLPSPALAMPCLIFQMNFSSLCPLL